MQPTNKLNKPMNESSTQKYEVGDIIDSVITEEQPSAKTIDFLKTFARTYYVEKSLPDQMNEICIN